METGKDTDLEDQDTQGHFMKSKDLVADIKSKVDLNDIIDVSFQGQDYTNGLNAEVDLDESADKEENQTDKDDGLDESGNNERNDNELINGHKDGTEKVNEEINLDNCKEGSSETIENKDTTEGEADIENSSEPEVKGNKELDNSGEIELTMGNNLEGKESSEVSVDGNFEENAKGIIHSQEEELENNNEKESLDNENSGPAKNVEHTEDSSKDGAKDPTDDTIQQDTASEENLKNSTDVVDTNVEENIEPKEEILDNESTECEGAKETELESQQNTATSEIEVETNSKECTAHTEENISAGKEEESMEDNNEIDDNGDEGIIDREKIKNFIKEVINDLQGIVIEADECDSVVNEMCDESMRSELVGDKAVNDDVNEEIRNSECPENSEESKPGEVIGSLEEKGAEISDESAGKISENKFNQQDIPCELVIKEDTDTTESSESQTENVPKINETASENLETSESNGEIPGDLLETHDQGNKHQDEIHNEHVVQGKQNITDGTQTEQPWKGQGKNDKTMVEEELKITQTALRKSQQCLQDERSKHNQDVISLKLQLYKSQTELKRQKSKSEKQLTEIMSHLVMLESRLRREQLKLQKDMKDKNRVIENQKHEIVKLKDQNEQLMNAIKEICANGGMNGYMRRKNGSYGDTFENSAKSSRDKKGHVGKLGTMKDKFSAKNRSSLELSSLNLEKYLIKNERLCSSQEDLHRLVDERRRSIPSGDERVSRNQRHDTSPKDRPVSDNSEYKNGNRKKHVRYAHQNFFSDCGSPKYEMNKSVSDSSQLSESSGFHSLSDHDLSVQNDSLINGNHGNHDFTEDDEDDDRIFSFSSTHINTVIDEEEAMGPIMSHSGQMMSMGSMPMLANLKEDQLGSGKNRPHSLSSVDLISIQQQAQNLSRLEHKVSPKGSPVSEMSTPPSSPSYIHAKNEMTPFQTFKTMFRRKGSSKSKGHKKRSVSLSQTTNMEYSEALKKHFQKYDMS